MHTNIFDMLEFKEGQIVGGLIKPEVAKIIPVEDFFFQSVDCKNKFNFISVFNSETRTFRSSGQTIENV